MKSLEQLKKVLLIKHLRKNIDNDEMLLFAVATEENIEKLGLNKSIYDKIVDEYFKDVKREYNRATFRTVSVLWVSFDYLLSASFTINFSFFFPHFV